MQKYAFILKQAIKITNNCLPLQGFQQEQYNSKL